MKISVIKSANEVVIGSLQITNEKLAKLMITINDMKNNLKKRRYTHWVKVSFKGLGHIELGEEPMCIGDYDEYPIAPDTKVIIPIVDTGEVHKQYICSTLNTPRLLQNKTLSENEEIIIVYTELINEEGNHNAVNEMILNGMKKCLFEYQMKVYTDHEGEEIDKALFNKRIEQIVNILPDLEHLIEQVSVQATEVVDKTTEKAVELEESSLYWEKTYDEAEVMEEPIAEYIQTPVVGSEENNEEIALFMQNEESNEEDYLEESKEKIVAMKFAETELEEEDKTEDLGQIITDEEQLGDDVKWVKLDLIGKNNNIE